MSQMAMRTSQPDGAPHGPASPAACLAAAHQQHATPARAQPLRPARNRPEERGPSAALSPRHWQRMPLAVRRFLLRA